MFAFPIVTMLIIGGAFGTRPDPAFDGTNPSHWYVASYLTVVIAVTGLVMLPVHLASYRSAACCAASPPPASPLVSRSPSSSWVC